MDRQTCERIFAEFCNKDPAMLFSHGKAGSTSLFEALRQQYDGKIVRLEGLPIKFDNTVRA